MPNTELVSPPDANTLQARKDLRRVLNTFSVVSSTSSSVESGQRSLAVAGSLSTFTIPPTFARGDVFEIANDATTPFRISQSAGQVIYWDGQQTTTGTSGYILASDGGTYIEILCIKANTDFMILSTSGTPALM